MVKKIDFTSTNYDVEIQDWKKEKDKDDNPKTKFIKKKKEKRDDSWNKPFASLMLDAGIIDENGRLIK